MHANHDTLRSALVLAREEEEDWRLTTTLEADIRQPGWEETMQRRPLPRKGLSLLDIALISGDVSKATILHSIGPSSTSSMRCWTSMGRG